ncbi:MAG: RecX family transcriptional regulator [Burkholderiaceae bacterium]
MSIGPPTRTLKSRALQLLALREHSRIELRRKLVAHLDRAARLARPAPAPAAAAATARRGESRSVVDAASSSSSSSVAASASASASAVCAAPADASAFEGSAATSATSVADPPDLSDALVAPEATDSGAAIDDLLDWLEARRFLSAERFVESRVHARLARFGNLRIRQELARHGLSIGAEREQQLRDSELDRARGVWERKFGADPVDPAGHARQARFLAARGFSGEVIARLMRETRRRPGTGVVPEDD